MRPTLLLTAGLLLTLAATLLALLAGASKVSLAEIAAVFGLGAPPPEWVRAVVVDVRLPRLLLGLAAGAVLAQSGVVLQALFRNPLAETSLLGISGGAALAAAIWLVLAPTWLQLGLGLPLAATVGAWLAVTAVIRLSRVGGVTDVPTLLLAGISINALAGAGIALLQTLATDRSLRELTLWLYGSLGRSDWSDLALGLPVLAAIALWLPREARALDALLLGEAEARHLGVTVEALKRRLVLLVAIGAATAVALAGVIGFVGLIVPHLLRLLSGPGHRTLLPASALFGASVLVLADTASRTLFAPLEIPAGVLTALLGVPIFLALLRREARR